MGPLISIIVPVYRVEAYLGKCIDSILAQTMRDFELILVDDGSPDRCGAICDDYVARDSRIRVLHTTNQGLGMARNAGLNVATGKFIGFVDSDDWIEPDMYDVLWRQIEAVNADLAICSTWFDGKGSAPFQTGQVHTWGRAGFAKMLSDDVVITNHLWNKLYRTNLLTGVRFLGGRDFEDIDFFTALLSRVQRVIYIEVPKYHYVWRVGGICSTQKPSSRLDWYEACLRRRSWIRSNYPDLDPYAVMSLIRPGFLLYDGYVLSLGVSRESARRVANDFKDWAELIQSSRLVPFTLKIKVWALIRMPHVYRSLRRLF